jgi:predicted metal-dependent phosphotriesterase family hydrolase
LKEERISPTAWIWVHAHAVKNIQGLLAAAAKGAWLEFDGLTVASLQHHMNLLHEMKQRGHLRQILLSHDRDAFPFQESPRPFETLFTTLIPALKRAGYTQAEIWQLTIENPANAFTLKIKAIS